MGGWWSGEVWWDSALCPSSACAESPPPQTDSRPIHVPSSPLKPGLGPPRLPVCGEEAIQWGQETWGHQRGEDLAQATGQAEMGPPALPLPGWGPLLLW